MPARSLVVYLNHRPIATLCEDADLWRLDYEDTWARDPEAFDLSPALPRAQGSHRDGGSVRPVQWYFDNLLPEEQLRTALSQDARIPGDDAFALLAYLGAESAGSLVLLPPDQPPRAPGGLRALTDHALSERIQALPRLPLQHAAAKRMSVAGAQHKLLVVRHGDGTLHEPVGSQPSTHLLKPNHPGQDYPCSVINEFATMSLASRLGLRTAPVWRCHVPEPVYLVERFDRRAGPDGQTERLHLLDACQLLNTSRLHKYQAATLDTLAALVTRCRDRVSTRLQLFRWLVFNLLVGNHDNHLKNLSFLVSAQGVALAPAYDLLSTAVWTTRAFADEHATWPHTPLAIPLPGARTFAEVSRPQALLAAEALGLTRGVGERELDRLVKALPVALEAVLADIARQDTRWPAPAQVYLGGQARLLRTVQAVVVAEMVGRLRSGT